MRGELELFFLLFLRISGFFLISPLFSHRAVPKTVRLGLALATALLITPTLLQSHENALSIPLPLFSIYAVKEVALGYFFGFLFSLLIEAAAFAGQVIGTLSGFSATELFDPLSSSSNPLISRLFALLVFTLFLAFDFHHHVLYLLYESFSLVPLSTLYPFTSSLTFGILEASNQLFHQALSYAIYPFTLLILVMLLLAAFSRHLPLFWTGFPIQLLIGFGAIALATAAFPQILEKSFYEFLNLAKKFISFKT